MEMKNKLRPIIIADDDDGDRFLVQKALRANGVENPIHFAGDGKELVEQLTKNLEAREPGKVSDLPCLILMDLNMPLMDGRETLKIIKNHDKLKEIPVMIFSNSDNPKDVSDSYQKGANTFFMKPLDYVELVALMGLLKTYWLQNAKMPVPGAF
jgi:two-component system, response regulator